ncbi:hypothetical protein CTAYLR_010781 [Chrysophaeum taylorii]|uniref:TauD/TfdA-like domain-containing protein n=1 Tax=Chrysophaeum taylorii TaxID=2483200 RepID=A0AAD7UJ11_9STRA|nr:hypothetical protein CTAYLR_010781 [Chrysophaeum taylorii]
MATTFLLVLWRTVVVAQECATTKRELGVVLDAGDLKTIEETGVRRIVEAVKQHGVVVIENQPLSRAEQVALSGKLGSVVILPPSFEGLDPEPELPAIQRVTNYWANGTWKGRRHSFGAYWHQDGQFWPRSHRWIFSMLACAAAPPSGGETGFADLRSSYATLDPDLKATAANSTIEASVRDIADFVRNAVPEELDLFDDVTHPVVDTFPGSGATALADAGDVILYVGSRQMRLVPPRFGFIDQIIDHATAAPYYHAWKPGDVVIWDNTQTLHKAHPSDSSQRKRTSLSDHPPQTTPRAGWNQMAR